jgi:predicted PurR-regulated permease PerM
VTQPDTDEVDAAAEAAVVAVRRQALFWLAAAAGFILFLYVFRSILLPFVAGMALAYFLDPVADRLERIGLSRLAATIVILAAFIVVLVVSLIIIVPILATQLADLIARLPSYVTALQSLLANHDSEWLKKFVGIDATVLQNSLNSIIAQGAGFLTTLIQSVWNSGKSIIDIAGLFVVTPVVAFYMLLDWDRMVAKVDSWVPRDNVATVREIAADVNRVIAGFVRGQGTTCILLGIIYATGLTIVGLNFGLLIGLFAGLISFIPYVGSIVGLVLALGVAAVQYWPHWFMIVAVAVVFFIGQFVEGNILQPKLVGSSVGLHPVWLMFALFAFGALFGFTGLLVAVPVSAAIGVLIRFAIGRYLQSPYYKGHGDKLQQAAHPEVPEEK